MKVDFPMKVPVRRVMPKPLAPCFESPQFVGNWKREIIHFNTAFINSTKKGRDKNHASHSLSLPITFKNLFVEYS